MKTKAIFAALLLPVVAVAQASSAPSSKRIYPDARRSAPVGVDALCPICTNLAKKTPPQSVTIAGRIYDPNLQCHRKLRQIPTGFSKVVHYAAECVCS